MKSLTGLFGVMVLVACSGCASIVSKSSWPVTVASTPPGACVTIKDRNGVAIHKGETPMTITLSSRGGFFVPARYEMTFEKAGFKAENTVLAGRLNGWYFGNIVFGGLIGVCIVDPATGAMWRLHDSLSMNLTPATVAAEQAVIPAPIPLTTVSAGTEIKR